MVNTFDKKQLRKVSNLIGFAFILQIIFTLAIMLFFGSSLTVVDNTMILALSGVVPPLVAFCFVIFALKFKLPFNSQRRKEATFPMLFVAKHKKQKSVELIPVY